MRVQALRAVCAAAIMAAVSGVAQAAEPARAPAAQQAQSSLLAAGDFGAGLSPLAGLSLQAGRDASNAGTLGQQSAQDNAPLLSNARAALSPYDSMTDGGSFVSAAIRLASNLRFHIAASTLGAEQRLAQSPQAVSRALIDGGVLPRQSNGSEAGLTWNFASWGTLGLTASQASETVSPIGGGAAGTARIAGAGVNGRVALGGGWVSTFAYREGTAQLAPQANLATSLAMRSYGMALSKRGIFSNTDALALAVTRPGQIYNGGIDLAAPTGVDLTRTLLGRNAAVAGAEPETDVELGYMTTYYGGQLTLQANAGYQMNVAGQNGSNAVTVLSRAKINF